MTVWFLLFFQGVLLSPNLSVAVADTGHVADRSALKAPGFHNRLVTDHDWSGDGSRTFVMSSDAGKGG